MLTETASENPVKVNPEPKLSAHHNACTAHMLTPSASENTKRLTQNPNPQLTQKQITAWASRTIRKERK
jgi:hypothetical protein